MNPFSQIPELTDAERAVADALPIGADPDEAARVLGRVPLWFHTFALNAAHGLYTPAWRAITGTGCRSCPHRSPARSIAATTMSTGASAPAG